MYRLLIMVKTDAETYHTRAVEINSSKLGFSFCGLPCQGNGRRASYLPVLKLYEEQAHRVCNTHSSSETSLSGFDVTAAAVVGCEYG